jgi:hypothetical protein
MRDPDERIEDKEEYLMPDIDYLPLEDMALLLTRDMKDAKALPPLWNGEARSRPPEQIEAARALYG